MTWFWRPTGKQFKFFLRLNQVWSMWKSHFLVQIWRVSDVFSTWKLQNLWYIFLWFWHDLLKFNTMDTKHMCYDSELFFFTSALHFTSPSCGTNTWLQIFNTAEILREVVTIPKKTVPETFLAAPSYNSLTTWTWFLLPLK